jgi:hypothetical protein
VRTYTPADGLAQASVYAVHEARDGSVWAGTLNGGLSRLQKGRFETFTTANGLPANSVTALLDSHDGTLWVGTPAGLAAWSAGTWTTRRVPDGLPSDNVAALFEDSEGVLWIGTSEGLAFLRSGRVESTPDSVPLREAVLGLAESEGGWLWVSTARRVMRVRREPLLAGSALVEGDVVSYGRADGLIGLEGVKRHRSVVAERSGRIWFSTNRGLAVVRPRRAVAPQASPLVHVRALFADEREIGLGEAVRVPPRPQRLRIAYTGVSLQAPARVRFRYRLDGLESEWSQAVVSEEAVYANLAPGPYQFRVTAAAADGAWNGPEVVLAFTIAPAVWQTMGFKLVASLLAGIAAWLAYSWRLALVTRRLNRAFEERLGRADAHRPRAPRHAAAGIRERLDAAARRGRPGFRSLARARASRAGPAARRTRDRGRPGCRPRVAQRRPRHGRPGAGALAGGRGASDDTSATLRVIVEGTPRPLHPSVREELYGIGREALVNALRHARAKRIEVELEYARRTVRLLVRDDGVGIDPEVVRAGRDGHFGLSGMRERAERIGGRLRLLSAAGAGTEVEVVVRGGVAFASPDAPRRWAFWRTPR